MTSEGCSYGSDKRGAESAAEWTALASPPVVSYYLLDGKIVDTDRHEGQLTQVSANEKYGILMTGTPLEQWQNLMINIGPEVVVYAKVMDCRPEGNRICFTSRPDGFSFLNP